MKSNKMLRYFKNYTPFLIAGIVFGGGGFLLWYYSWELWRLGTPLMVVGVAFAVIYFVLRIDDRQYTEYIDAKLEAMPKDHECAPDYTFDGYAFEQNSFAKLEKNGTPRSEIAVRTHVYMGKKLKVVCGTVNVQTDTVDFKVYEFPGVSAQVENLEVKVNQSTKKLSLMKLVGDGVECTFPVKYNDIEVDQFCEKIAAKYK